MNRLLGNDEKKNRENDKHHALDAICISYSKDFRYNTEKHKYEIDNLDIPHIEEVINSIVPYPYTNDKPLKSAVAPEETIYGKKIKDGKTYITKRISLADIKKDTKSINKISDEDIKKDLLLKSEQNLSERDWTNLLQDYIHPKRGTRVKKVITLEEFKGKITYDSNGRERLGEYCDFGNKGTKGQFKRSKQHRGQILYFDDKGKVKVMPVYSNKKVQDVKDELINMGCKLYRGGEMFNSGCQIEIPNDFKAGSNMYPKGLYKLSTITTAGQIKIENNSGNQLLTSATYLVQAEFKKSKKKR